MTAMNVVTPRSPRLLQIALGANLLFSNFCAFALLFQGAAIGQAIGVPVWLLTAIGAGLIGFGLAIAFVLVELRIGYALIISTLDLLWVVITVPLLAVPGLFTDDGKMLVAAIAAVVGGLACLQLWGIRTMLLDGQNEAGTYRHCVRLKSGAAPETLWAVIRDLGAIAQYSAALKSSRMIGAGGPIPGAVRVCTDVHDRQWAEEVIEIDDAARTLALRFQSEAEDFPFPFSAMTGGWAVEPAPGGALVDIWWTVRPRQPYVGWLLLAAMTIPLDNSIRSLVAAMETGEARGADAGGGRLPSLAYC